MSANVRRPREGADGDDQRQKGRPAAQDQIRTAGRKEDANSIRSQRRGLRAPHASDSGASTARTDVVASTIIGCHRDDMGVERCQSPLRGQRTPSKQRADTRRSRKGAE